MTFITYDCTRILILHTHKKTITQLQKNVFNSPTPKNSAQTNDRIVLMFGCECSTVSSVLIVFFAVW